MLGYITYNSSQIDNESTLGLEGTSQSLAYRVHGVESHFHAPERWIGKRGTQTATDWGTPDSIAPFRAISGDNTYGADANDEALILGTGDSPLTVGNLRFDIHRIFVIDASKRTPYKLRIAFGSTTLAAAISAGAYSEVITKGIPTDEEENDGNCPGLGVDVRMPRCVAGTDKVWVQAWNATDNATVDFLVGLHEYVG